LYYRKGAKAQRRKGFGVRSQSAAVTPLSTPFKNGVALSFPPQSKPRPLRVASLRLCVFALIFFIL
jgi:hypothetical protein